jgi:DNA-binding NarL/FixJ family response regulator
MTAHDVNLLLTAHRAGDDDAQRIRAFARGHALTVVVAAEALARHPGLPIAAWATARAEFGSSGAAASSPEPRRGGADRPAVLTLTAREQEVLALLAEGMTNAELARTLFISERTANRHISSIFTKLGVHNRTQAARAWRFAGPTG